MFYDFFIYLLIIHSQKKCQTAKVCIRKSGLLLLRAKTSLKRTKLSVVLSKYQILKKHFFIASKFITVLIEEF